MLTPTPKQKDLLRLFGTGATHLMAYGGSRSGKTFGLCYALALRACKYPESRHGAFRFRFNHIKQSIVLDTFPKVLRIGMPDVKAELNRTDWFYQFPNGSEVWFGGLDDKERVEKVLGKEFGTLYFNECSQLEYASVLTGYTRLAQRIEGMRNLCLYDCNPPAKSHWTYKLFVKGIDPVTNLPIDPAHYAAILMNPGDNLANISEAYIRDVLDRLPPRQRARFLLGKFADDVIGALWRQEWIDRNRAAVVPGGLVNIVVALDPAVTSGDESAENGLIVAGVDAAGHGYVLEDASFRGTSAEWARKAVELYLKWRANTIVAEVNQGGDLVVDTIRTVDKLVSVTKVRATQGKLIRAEPVAALYEQNTIHHVGLYPELEEQLTAYNGESASPDRMDALVWALSHLMLKQSSLPNIRSL